MTAPNDNSLFHFDDLFDEEHLGLLGHLDGDGHLFDDEPISLPSLTPATNASTATTSADQTSVSSLEGKPKVADKVGKKKKQRKRETKKKILSSKTPSDKPPKRPLSAYNIFFKYERQKILWPDKKRDSVPSKLDLATDNDEPGGRKEPHYKIGFAELARTISTKWNALDDASRSVFQEQAVIDQQRYRREISAWEELQLNKEIHRKRDECKALPTAEDPVTRLSISNSSIPAVSPCQVHIMPKRTFSTIAAANTGTTMPNAHLNFHNQNNSTSIHISKNLASLAIPSVAPAATPNSAPGEQTAYTYSSK